MSLSHWPKVKKGRASSPIEGQTPLDLAFIHETFGASSVDRPAVSFRDYRARLEVGLGALPFENNQPRYSMFRPIGTWLDPTNNPVPDGPCPRIWAPALPCVPREASLFLSLTGLVLLGSEPLSYRVMTHDRMITKERDDFFDFLNSQFSRQDKNAKSGSRCIKEEATMTRLCGHRILEILILTSLGSFLLLPRNEYIPVASAYIEFWSRNQVSNLKGKSKFK